MADENTLRQAFNQVHVEGILSEKDLEEAEIKRKDSTDNAIRGTLSIETAENEVHQIRIFTYEHKKSGGANPVFKSLQTVMNDYKAIADDGVGRENADLVRITQGQLGINDFVGQDGALRSYPQISANFINRIKDKTELDPKAIFKIEGFVKSIKHEEKNDEETGRLLVEIIIPEYGAKVAPLEFVVDKDLAPDFEGLYQAGDSGEFEGDIINHRELIEHVEKGGIGKAKKTVTPNFKRELSITWASDPFEDDGSKYYNPKTIKKALVERDIYLDDLKNGKNKKSNSSTRKGGIGKKHDNDSADDIDDDDLPF